MHSLGIVTKAAAIPHSEIRLPPWDQLAGDAKENFRRLRTLLAQSGEALCLALSSNVLGEGVTWIATGLACAFAERDVSVALIQGQSSGGDLAEKFGLKEPSGTALNCECAVQFVLRATGSPLISVVTPEESADRTGLESSLRTVIPLLRRKASVVIVDCEPMALSSQVLQLSDTVDGALLVVELERERREVVRRNVQTLESAHIPVLGVLLNKRRRYVPSAVYERL